MISWQSQHPGTAVCRRESTTDGEDVEEQEPMAEWHAAKRRHSTSPLALSRKKLVRRTPLAELLLLVPPIFPRGNGSSLKSDVRASSVNALYPLACLLSCSLHVNIFACDRVQSGFECGEGTRQLQLKARAVCSSSPNSS